MTMQLIPLIKKHSSLIIMLLASFSMFCINVIAKKTLPSDIYTWLALYLIYIGYLGTLSFFASENVLIRYSVINEGVIFIQRNLLFQMSIAWGGAFVIIPAVGSWVSNNNEVGILFFYAPFLFFSTTVLFSIIYRLVGSFFVSQVILHGWKIFFLIIFTILSVCEEVVTSNVVAIVFIISAAIMAFLAIVYFYASKNIVIRVVESVYSIKEITSLQYMFFLSFVYFAILGSADRIILSGHIEPILFSEYLYLITLLLFPINIITNYVGFKELIYIKRGKLVGISNEIYKSITVTLLLYMSYSGALFLSKNVLSINFDLYVWGAVLIIVACKTPYAIYSSILGAKGNTVDIRSVNYISIFVLLVVCVITYLCKDIHVAIYAVSSAWIARVSLFYLSAKKYVQ